MPEWVKALLLSVAIILGIAFCAYMSVLMWPAHAFDSGQYEGVDPGIRSWFKSVRSPHGVPCCDISDGHVTTWERKPDDDHYWVPIEGELRQVPHEAVITTTSHPQGETVVWYVRQGPDALYIRCFVPGRGV